MSNALAVATVTEALRGFLAANLLPEITFAVDVTARKPFTEPPTDPTISVFCYQVTPNPAQRNRDAPTRTADGVLLTRPRAALDLHYLISCYGNETEVVPQKLLGAVIRALYVQPVLARADIETAATQPFLRGSDLAAAPDRVRFTPSTLDIDDQYKLWTMLSQTPYALSVCYQASLVFIEGRTGAPPGKPVERRTVTVLPGGRPSVERVLSRPRDNPDAPPVEGPAPRDNDLVIEGNALAADAVFARLGPVDVAVPADAVTDTRILVRPPDDLPPGVHPLRVLQNVAADQTTTLVKVLQSNVAPFVRMPRVTATENAPKALTISLDLPVGAEQRVQLLLDEFGSPAERAPRAYQFDAPFPLSDARPPEQVTVPLGPMAAGTYLVRVQVDGAQSPIVRDAAGQITGPVTTLPEVP
ncbi:DUF4255 domain-containing protein [Mangrovihabitans endophyticus]|uniref:Pvc16 N-terminal domain-containing protein n=1 Tax=Mangrovihabitans endophyticus TaxID=1751298 RepID=A0A8J3BSL2_9ACTN|nr:DUF4255 domain-containing protein [Mangrovihabitans endophyticus]GGK74500.1 hypothetical protein GCM10012284_05560 [Mangrovihabitans endophyticus]